MTRRSAPRSSRCVANECRSACGLIPNRVLHAATYFRTRRSTLRVDNRPPCSSGTAVPQSDAISSRFCHGASSQEPAAARELFSIPQPRPKRCLCRSIEWHDPFLATLAEDADDAAAQVHILESEPDELAEPKPGCVEQFEDRAVAAPERRRRVRHVEQPRHFRLCEMRRQAVLRALACRRAPPDRRQSPPRGAGICRTSGSPQAFAPPTRGSCRACEGPPETRGCSDE